MDEIKTPNFVNDRYYRSKYEEYRDKNKENERIIKNLKIHNNIIKIIGAGAILVLAGTNPKVQNIFDVSINKFVEYRNEMFNNEKENEINEIEELNDRSIEDIMDSGRIK